MWFCYSFLRTEPEIPLLWIFISHKRMQQLILNAPIDIIYHLSYLQYFDLLKINNVIYKKIELRLIILLIFINHISWLFDYVYITWKDQYQINWFVYKAPSNLYAKNHSTVSWATSSHLQLNESSSISCDIQIVGLY